VPKLPSEREQRSAESSTWGDNRTAESSHRRAGSRKLLGGIGALSATLTIAIVAAPHALASPVYTVSQVTDISSSCADQNAEVEQAMDPSLRYVYADWMGCKGIAFAVSTDGGGRFDAPISLPGTVGSNFNVWDPAGAVVGLARRHLWHFGDVPEHGGADLGERRVHQRPAEVGDLRGQGGLDPIRRTTVMWTLQKEVQMDQSARTTHLEPRAAVLRGLAAEHLSTMADASVARLSNAPLNRKSTFALRLRGGYTDL
jgi:hypothetical protein